MLIYFCKGRLPWQGIHAKKKKEKHKKIMEKKKSITPEELCNNLPNEISIQVSNLNSLIIYKDLTEIFDSSLSLNTLQILPIDILEDSNILFNKINSTLNQIDNENGDFKNYLEPPLLLPTRPPSWQFMFSPSMAAEGVQVMEP